MRSLRRMAVILTIAVCMVVPVSTSWAAEASSSVEVESTGWVSVACPSVFSDAEILTLTLDDYATSAVVDEGTLAFYATSAGTYAVGRTGDDVWSLVDALSDTSLLTHISDRKCLRAIVYDSDTGGLRTWSNFNPYRTCSDESLANWGSDDEPITVLTHFVGTSENPSGSLEMNQSVANALLGYSYASTVSSEADEESAEATEETDFQPTYLLVEDRNENTGALIASCLFTPDSDSAPAADGEGYVQAFNFVVNPTEELLAERLFTHSDYEDDTSLAASAAQQIVEAEALENTVVLANLDTMCAYNTGEKIYTLDIATLSDGVIQAGDEVVLAYLVGSGDENANDGVASDFESSVEETYETYTVDDEGYVTISLYGGGVYALGAEDEVSEIAIVPVASTTATDDGADDDDSDDGTAAAGSSTDTTSSDTSSSTTLSTTSLSSTALSSGVVRSASSLTASSASGSDSDDESDDESSTSGATDAIAAMLVEGVDTEGGPLDAESVLSSEEAADEAASAFFRNEDGTLKAAPIAGIVAAVVACAGVAALLVRRQRRAKAAEVAAAAEKAAAEALAAQKNQAPKTPEEAARAAAAAAKAASAAYVAAPSFSASSHAASASSSSSRETIEQRIRRKAHVSSDNTQLVGSDIVAGDALAHLAGA